VVTTPIRFSYPLFIFIVILSEKRPTKELFLSLGIALIIENCNNEGFIVPKSKRDGRQARRKLAVLRTTSRPETGRSENEPYLCSPRAAIEPAAFIVCPTMAEPGQRLPLSPQYQKFLYWLPNTNTNQS
jgi:hypothetical protein